MNHYTTDFRKKVVVQHLRDGRTIASLAAELPMVAEEVGEYHMPEA